MSQAVKAPPRKTTARSASSKTPAVPDGMTPNERRTKGLNDLGSLGQGLCLLGGQYADAAAVGRYWGPIAAELANLSDTYEAVSRPVDLLIQAGPFAALFAAVMPLGLQIAANHRWVNAEALAGHGIVSPEVLEAQMRAEVARMQTEALMAQQIALREAKEAEAAYAAEMDRAQVDQESYREERTA